MFNLIGAGVVLGFAAYGFVCWWRKTCKFSRAADKPRNGLEECGRADGD